MFSPKAIPQMNWWDYKEILYAAATTWSWKINHSITPNYDYLTQNNATIDIWLLKSNDLSNLGIIIDKKLICI